MNICLYSFRFLKDVTFEVYALEDIKSGGMVRVKINVQKGCTGSNDHTMKQDGETDRPSILANTVSKKKKTSKWIFPDGEAREVDLNLP